MSLSNERPPWCPHPSCTPRAGFNAQVCIGELPTPEPPVPPIAPRRAMWSAWGDALRVEVPA